MKRPAFAIPWIIFCVAAVLSCPSLARAATETLAADLSEHLIAIRTDFTGTKVLAFGTIDAPGDVIVVVRGPDSKVEIRRKAPVSGIWLTQDRVRFNGVPGYYAVAASRPVADILDVETLKQLQIGTDHIAYRPRSGTDIDDIPVFTAALIQGKGSEGLYTPTALPVSFLGSRLFRAEFTFPANVPTGNYSVQIMLVRDRQIIAVQTTPLIISKLGTGAEIYDFAHRHSAFYGLTVIMGALFAGWIAHLLFRRR